MSRPTVGSSSSRSCGRCSSARAISTRRRWPPLSWRTLSPSRSLSPTRPIASETSRSTSRPPNAWLTPATTRGAAAFCAVIGVAASMAPLRLLPLDDDTARPSWPHDHAPGLVADRHRLDDTEIRHVDHRHIVADAIGRIEAALVAVEGEGPDALPDQEIFLPLVGLRIDPGNTTGRRDAQGDLAGDTPSGDVDDGDEAAALIGDIEVPAIGMEREGLGVWAARQRRAEGELLEIERFDLVVVAGADVESLLVLRQHDAARPLPDRDGAQHLQALAVEHGDRIALLVRHEHRLGAGAAGGGGPEGDRQRGHRP